MCLCFTCIDFATLSCLLSSVFCPMSFEGREKEATPPPLGLVQRFSLEMRLGTFLLQSVRRVKDDSASIQPVYM